MIYLQESGQFLRFQRKVQIILAIVWGILADFCVPHERDNWNVQNMLDLWFSEASQNLSSFIHFHCFIGGLCTLWTCVKLKTSNSFSGVLQRTCMLFAVAQMQKRLWRLKHKITNLELFGPSFFVRAWTTKAWWRNRLHYMAENPLPLSNF